MHFVVQTVNCIKVNKKNSPRGQQTQECLGRKTLADFSNLPGAISSPSEQFKSVNSKLSLVEILDAFLGELLAV